MKYVRVDVTLGSAPNRITRKLVVSFPNDLIHKDMAQAIVKVCRQTWKDCTTQVVSAGEINLMAKGTHGRSGSLHLDAREEDAQLVFQSDYGGHVDHE